LSQREIVALITLLILVALVTLVLQTVRKRIAKQSDLGSLNAETALNGDLLAVAFGQYVSTVFSGNTLQRVMSHGLMHRGRAEIRVLADGIQVLRTGEQSFSIPQSLIVNVTRSNVTIDRAVETNGMVSVSWMLGATQVETNFRLNSDDDSEQFFEYLSQFKSKDANS
jgi:hypothetical protein